MKLIIVVPKIGVSDRRKKKKKIGERKRKAHTFLIVLFMCWLYGASPFLGFLCSLLLLCMKEKREVDCWKEK